MVSQVRAEIGPRAVGFLNRPILIVAKLRRTEQGQFHRLPIVDFLALWFFEHAVIDKAFEGTWAVLDGRWVEFVPHPSWTIPLMAAYGVPIENSWPKTYPAPADVLHALFDDSRLNSPFGNPEHDNATVIDLDTIKAIDEFQVEPQRTTMSDLKGVKIDHRVWQFSIVGVLSALVLMILLPAQWVEARIACGILMGAAGCAGMLPYLMHIITVPRSGLAKEQYLPPERCPKNAGRQGNRKLG